MEQLIQRLRNQFSQARIAETGSLFIFNQENELIVSPERFAESQDFRSFFPSLAEASQDNELIKSFVDGEKMIFYTRYFRPLGWYLGAMIPEAEIQAPAKSLVRSQSMIIAVIFLLGAIAAIFFVRHISRPLGILAEEAENMARRDLTADDSHSGQIVELTRKYHDEVGALAGSFMFMQEELRKNVRQLVETTAAKERFQSELNMARDIQMSMVPKKFPPFPEIKEFDLFAMLDPAREVGGDLYDFFMLDEDHLCFTLGDVSDKGMPAALYMAIARTLIQSHAASETSPALIMSRVNDDLSKDNPKSMFVTLIIAVMNIRTGNIRYANAGHNLPVVLAGRKKCHYAKGISGPVAGAMEGINYKEISIDLMPGQGLFLYSDGVTEAMNHNQDLFSDERLLCDMIDVQALDVEELIRNIRERVTIFADGAPQSDDITMLMLKYNGNFKTRS